jgi:hypothetical protein
MPAVAIKISQSLADQARAVAPHADRSLTGQVEHWARIGHAVEPFLSVAAIAALKKCGGDLSRLEDPSERAALLECLENIRRQPSFVATMAHLAQPGAPLYEADPADPLGVIQISPNGVRTAGKFINRVFVPSGA